MKLILQLFLLIIPINVLAQDSDTEILYVGLKLDTNCKSSDCKGVKNKLDNYLRTKSLLFVNNFIQQKDWSSKEQEQLAKLTSEYPQVTHVLTGEIGQNGDKVFVKMSLRFVAIDGWKLTNLTSSLPEMIRQKSWLIPNEGDVDPADWCLELIKDLERFNTSSRFRDYIKIETPVIPQACTDDAKKEFEVFFKTLHTRLNESNEINPVAYFDETGAKSRLENELKKGRLKVKVKPIIWCGGDLFEGNQFEVNEDKVKTELILQLRKEILEIINKEAYVQKIKL